jgi:hypothetical protein
MAPLEPSIGRLDSARKSVSADSRYQRADGGKDRKTAADGYGRIGPVMDGDAG